MFKIKNIKKRIFILDGNMRKLVLKFIHLVEIQKILTFQTKSMTLFVKYWTGFQQILRKKLLKVLCGQGAYNINTRA